MASATRPFCFFGSISYPQSSLLSRIAAVIRGCTSPSQLSVTPCFSAQARVPVLFALHVAVGVALREAHFQKDFEADAEHAGGHGVAADDFSEILAIEGRGILRIGHGHEEAHADFVLVFA